VNVPEAVIGIATAGALTNSLFGVGLVPFFTEGWDQKKEGASWELTLAELVGRVANMGVYGPTAKGLTGSSEAGGEFVGWAIKKNLKSQGPMAIGGLLGVMAVNMGIKKIGGYRRLNRLVRQVGLGKVVKFS
jgi:uncharacterized membrane protein YqgA involved in biofilm formation